MPDLSDFVLNEFPKRKVVIIGDIVADQFLHGTIARVSREAPVFILDHDSTDTRAGGAANAAANVASLGGRTALVGFAGTDANGELLRETLRQADVNCEYLVADGSIRTTTKVRVLAGQHYAPRQQVIRIDYANRTPIDPHLSTRLVEKFAAASDGADAIIVSDYGHGAVHPEIFEIVRRRSEELAIPLLIDSRYRLASFTGATAATPNQEEAEQLLGKDLDPQKCSELRERLGLRALLITRGNQGMTLFEAGSDPIHLNAVGSKEPVDVTGAGDTVIGAFALGIASGLSFYDAANVANHAGGVVVMKRGTAVATIEELQASLKSHPDNLRKATRI